jgi:hypothetical protein
MVVKEGAGRGTELRVTEVQEGVCSAVCVTEGSALEEGSRVEERKI